MAMLNNQMVQLVDFLWISQPTICDVHVVSGDAPSHVVAGKVWQRCPGSRGVEWSMVFLDQNSSTQHKDHKVLRRVSHGKS